nr:alpha/beta fold hydrolase [Gammaproteobacteria bacterium]NIX58356.1 alpha/beta fold hydrolase [candidate division Zixibacteria bacterium]
GLYHIPMFAADLLGLLSTIGTGKIHLVGISLGGCIAYQFAVDYLKSVKTLTIVNSIPSVNQVSDAMQETFVNRVDIIHKFGMRWMAEGLSESLFPYPEQINLRNTMVERWTENDPQAYIEAFRSLLSWSVEDHLGSIDIPTLIISSDQDTFPVELKQVYARSMPDAEMVVIPDAHHFLPMEKPAEFNEALLAFIERHT